MQFQSKSQSAFCYKNKLIQKFIWKGKEIRRVKTILKKNKVGGCMLLESYSSDSGVRTDIQIQRNETESPETDLHIFGQLTFDKGTKAIQQRKNNLSNKWSWNKWIIHLENGSNKNICI